MTLADEIARVRSRARGAEINARHRRGREKAQRMAAGMGPPAPPDGVHPEFARSLDAARERARVTVAKTEAKGAKAPVDRIEQLVREGKLPPRTGDAGVGYEPTAEEILGELGAGASPPDGTEDLPDAASVLAGDALPRRDDTEPRPEGWGQAPGAGSPQAPTGAPGATGLAHKLPAVHHKRKRGK